MIDNDDPCVLRVVPTFSRDAISTANNNNDDQHDNDMIPPNRLLRVRSVTFALRHSYPYNYVALAGLTLCFGLVAAPLLLLAMARGMMPRPRPPP